MDQIEHKLSRLALAKAIKQGESADSWDKSVIFNQPFVKDLQQQKRHKVPDTRRTKRTLEEKQAPLESKEMRRSKPVIKTVDSRTKKKKNACLPSDSEESDDDTANDRFSSEEDDDDDNIVSQLVTRKKENLPTKVNRKSNEYDSNSPSRGSLASSISLPLTEEDEEDDNNSKRYPTYHKPPPPIIEPTTMMPAMVDPMYLQRMQNYQYQLQLQQQYQYQQFLAAQNAYSYPMMRPQYFEPPYQQKQHRPQQKQHHQQRHSGHSNSSVVSDNSQKTPSKKYTNTDMRRRAEMLRNSNEYKTH